MAKHAAAGLSLPFELLLLQSGVLLLCVFAEALVSWLVNILGLFGRVVPVRRNLSPAPRRPTPC